MFNSFFVTIIKIYKICLSPFLSSNCRFFPSCSSYAINSIEKHGILRGVGLSVVRIFRCNPFNDASYYDPAP